MFQLKVSHTHCERTIWHKYKAETKKLRTNYYPTECYRVHIQEVPKTEGHEFDSQYFQS